MQWLNGLIAQAREAAPGLLGQAAPGQPTGFQPPGSANEIIFSPDKATGDARAGQFADDGGHPVHDRRGPEKSSFRGYDRTESFATDVGGGYTGDEDRPYEFGGGYGGRGGHGSRGSPQRQAGPPVVADIDQGLVTAPNGVGVGLHGMGNNNVNVDGPYDAYHANANMEGPYRDVPPTTPSLSMPPPFPYPAVSPDAHYGHHSSGPGYSQPDTAPFGDYSPPGTAGGHWGQSHGPSQPSSPSRQGVASMDQREAWAPGSILEVYSASAGNWHVARVINAAAEVLTVQFMAEDGPKQKSLYRSDKHLAPLGARGGPPELPPGFQMRGSKSRPGQEVFLDATTGVKYASLELAWSLHFERLAKNSAPGLEMTVAGPHLRRLQEDRESSMHAGAPSAWASQEDPRLGTCGRSFELGPGALPVPEMPVHSLIMTETAVVPSCRSEDPHHREPQAISLAELMNRKQAGGSSSSYGAGQPPPSFHNCEFGAGQPPPSQPAEWVPVPSLGAGGPIPTMGGKIALPSFGDRAPRDNQSAYLQHLAAPQTESYEGAPQAAEAVAAMPFAERQGGDPYAQGGDPYGNTHGFSPGQAPSVPRRAPPVRTVAPQQQAWVDDPFSQWRRG